MKFIAENLIIHAFAFLATACAYTNHFIDEEDEPNSYAKIVDINASPYNSWIYINLQTGETETHPDYNPWIYSSDGSIREAQVPEEITIDWHIAIHRYEFKTNGAEVFNTAEKNMESVIELPTSDSYISDETITYESELAKSLIGEKSYLLTMDMTNMMNGSIGYSLQATINRTLCNSVIRTSTGTMPPVIYSTDAEVLVLRWDNDDWAKIQLTGVYGTEGSKLGASGYISMNYKYYSAN